MKKKRKSFAGRLTRHLLIWLFIIVGGLSYLIVKLTMESTPQFYAVSYHNSTLAVKEYTRRVLSDVYVAVTNNVYDLENNLDKPEELLKTMERMVNNNTRIRSCGISFIESYFPQKGRLFCPYAWRSSNDSSLVKTQYLGDTQHNYLDKEWFTSTIEKDSAHWSEPFFDGNDAKTPLVSYMVPIHDRQGRTVAVLGADVSLDWLTNRLAQSDNAINTSSFAGSNSSKLAARSYIIRRDGTFITHPDESRILKDNFFSHIKDYEENETETLIDHIEDGITRDQFDSYVVLLLDDSKHYVFHTPIEYTDWTLVTAVPWMAIAISGILVNVMMIFLILMAMLVIVVVCYFTIKYAVRPLRKLAVSADEVAKGHFDAPLPAIKHNDEIRQLRDSFENMQHSLVSYMDDLKETTASKTAIENELKIAHDIQMSMLPKTFPPFPERNDLDVYGQLTPAKAVGGDLFDFFINHEQLFFCIGDVSGKGVPASLVMAVTRSLFRNISAHTADPSRIVTALNNALAEGNETSMFVTLFVGVLNLTNGQLLYCNAGHDAPLLVNDDVSVLPVDSNLPVGVMQGWDFTDQQVRIERGTTIFLFTDGLTEAEDCHHAQFGEDRIMRMCQKAVVSHQTTPTQLTELMTAAVHSFVGEAEQSDDLTMLAITLNKLS